MDILKRLRGRRSESPGKEIVPEGGAPVSERGEEKAAPVRDAGDSLADPKSGVAPARAPQASRWDGVALTAEEAQSRLARIETEIMDMLMGRSAATTIALDTVEELSVVAKFIWDGDPRRADAQALYSWAKEKHETQRGPFGLGEQDRELMSAVAWTVRALVTPMGAERIAFMQESLRHARAAGKVGGASFLATRLSHTLGPMGMLPDWPDPD